MSAAADVLGQYSAAAVAVEFLFTIESVQRNNENLQVTKAPFVRIVRQTDNNVLRITIRPVGVCAVWIRVHQALECVWQKNIRSFAGFWNSSKLHALDVKSRHWSVRLVQSPGGYVAREKNSAPPAAMPFLAVQVPLLLVPEAVPKKAGTAGYSCSSTASGALLCACCQAAKA
jgi:hypothetical protein